jgi:flagellar protein FlbD
VIQVTKLNGLPLLINAELIEQLQQTPDTVIMLTSGTSVVVKETVDQVLSRVLDYRRSILQGPIIPQEMRKNS